MRVIQLLALPLTCALSFAQVQLGDLLVETYSLAPGESAFLHFTSDGTLIGQTAVGTGFAWIGVAATPAGRIVVGRQRRNGINVYDGTTLTELLSWDTSGGVGADVEVLVDGVVAVADQSGPVSRFLEDGTPLGSITHPQLVSPIGLGRDPGGDLWVTDIHNDTVFRFDRAGTLVSSFKPGFFSPDVVAAPDGTVWLIHSLTGYVHHFTPKRTPLGSFHTNAIPGLAMGIALCADGSLWVSSYYATEMFHYSPTGTLLAAVVLGGTARPLFLRVVDGNLTGGVSFCSGDGSGTVCPCNNSGSAESGCANGSFAAGYGLTAAGNASVSSDSLTLSVARSVGGETGLFFQANDSMKSGDGVTFGDGLRCVGGQVIRVEFGVAGPGGEISSTVGIAAESGIIAGDVKRYQWWYRDPVGSPCGTGFNLSNGLEITWSL